MRVFVVEQCYEYEGCTVLKVFSTKEGAEAWVAEEIARRGDADGYSLGEHPVRWTAWEVE